MSHPTITTIDIYKLTVPSKPYRISLGVIDSADNLLVRIQTSSGLYGLGEAAPIAAIAGETQATCYAASGLLARLLIGKEALAVEARLAELDAALHGNHTVKSAFDMALYDLLGKHAGLPLYALLGGERRPIVTDLTIGIDSPEAMAREALAATVQGFPAVKAKLGSGWAADVARMRAVRGALGPDVPLRIDANQGWDVPAAIAALNAMAPLGIEYCEQPVAAWDVEGLAAVRQRSPIPITADEALMDHHDAFRLACRAACDYFNIKLAKAGGIAHALKINAIGEAAGIRCMIGSMTETRLGLSAAAHLAAARPNIAFANLDTNFFHLEDPVTGGIAFERGVISLPDAPGHGADIGQEVLARLEGICVR
jgi:L-alanine-DL-glutamate epimerase-like enolase superfamily enzyme